MTALDLGGWIFIYFGIGLIRAGLASRADGTHHGPGRKLAAPGYCLVVVGAFVLCLDMLHHFH